MTKEIEFKYQVATDLIEEIVKWNAFVVIPDWDIKKAKIQVPEKMSDGEFWCLIAGLTRHLYDYRDTFELWNSDVIGGRDD